MADTDANADDIDLEAVVAALRGDYSGLRSRLRELQHTVTCEVGGVTLRLHFPAFRQGRATVYELIDAISLYMTPFALSRKEILQLDQMYGTVSAARFRVESKKLDQAAVNLFIKASKVTGRNGECGELLLYLLTEWILDAPQIIAKMSLKTNPRMPVYGADGVHARYRAEDNRLYLYWGEAKLHANVKSAISDAADSLATALQPEKLEHEILLVKRNIDLSTLEEDAREALLDYLDPMEENYNRRFDVITCLIGFDFDGYKSVGPEDGDSAEAKFSSLATSHLSGIAPTIAEKLKACGLGGACMEIFLLPVPSVQELRNLFQRKIGWPTE